MHQHQLYSFKQSINQLKYLTSVENESWVDSMATLRLNLKGDITWANIAFQKSYRNWMWFIVHVFNSIDGERWRSLWNKSEKNSEQIKPLLSFEFINKSKTGRIYLWIAESNIFGLEQGWFSDDIFGAKCTCCHIAPGCDRQWVHQTNTQTRHNQKHSELHFIFVSTLWARSNV